LIVLNVLVRAGIFFSFCHLSLRRLRALRLLRGYFRGWERLSDTVGNKTMFQQFSVPYDVGRVATSELKAQRPETRRDKAGGDLLLLVALLVQLLHQALERKLAVPHLAL